MAANGRKNHIREDKPLKSFGGKKYKCIPLRQKQNNQFKM